MNKKNIIPQQAQPINRITTGQLPSELAELSEEVLHGSLGDSGVLPSYGNFDKGYVMCYTSFDGDDAE